MKTYPLLVGGIISFFLLTAGTMYHAGSPGGRSGSLGDGGANCTQCHTGSPVQDASWITTDIPATGYVPGETYNITLSGSHVGAQRYGFELTSENASNGKVGKFQIIQDSYTQLTTAAAVAVTHTNLGITPVNDAAEWVVQWIAPEAGTGSVTFYAAINAANGNGTTSGDVIYLAQISVDEFEETVSINSPTERPSVLVFPNPTTKRLQIQSAQEQIRSMSLIDMQGKMHSVKSTQQNGFVELNLQGLPKGFYWINIQTDKGMVSEKILLQ